MKLTEIDGDVLMSESLRSELEPEPAIPSSGPSYTAVTAGDTVIGALLGFSFTSTSVDVTCATVGNPFDLLAIPIGASLGIQGVVLGKDYAIEEIACNIEGRTCSLKSILRNS